MTSIATPTTNLLARISHSPFGPALLVIWPIWLVIVVCGGYWGVVWDNILATATMVVGAFIAGATAEGGGAVAFPVFTLGLGITPGVARDFSFLCQCVGMGAAALTIVAAGVPVCWRTIKYAGIGGVLGTAASVLWLQPNLPAPVIKMFFVSLWLGIGFALALIYRQSLRAADSVCVAVPARTGGLSTAPLLVSIGVFGGVISGLVGSGLDLFAFACCALLFGLDERIGTPTSVVLMATNTLFGAVFTGIARPALFPDMPGLAPQAFELWLAAIPACAIMAPVGAWYIRNKSRLFVLSILWVSMVGQYLGALLLVPNARTAPLLALSGVTIVVSLGLFWGLARARMRVH